MADMSDVGTIEEVARRLAVWAESATGGIALVRYDSEFARHAAIDRLTGELERRGMSSTVHDLGVVPVSERVEALSKALALAEPFSVVQASGLANTPSSDVEARERLGPWNFARERLALPNIAQVWWMPRAVGDALARTAPDLYSWLLLRLDLTEIPAYARTTQEGEPVRFGDEAMARGTAKRLEDRLHRLSEQDQGGVIGLDAVLHGVEVLDDAGLFVEASGLLVRLAHEQGFQGGEEWADSVSRYDPIRRASLSERLGTHAMKRGDFALAKRFWTQVLEIRQEFTGEDSPEVLTAMNNLAHLMLQEGEVAEACVLYEAAFAKVRNLYGENAPVVLMFMNNLSSAWLDLGNLEGALALNRRVLIARRETLGNQHPDTLISMNNLADTLLQSGRPEEAEALLREALQSMSAVLGVAHPATLTLTTNYAGTLYALGRFDEARALCEKSYAVRSSLLGRDHPETLDSLSSLAQCLGAMGDVERARNLIEEAVALSSSVRGEEHPVTLNHKDILQEISGAPAQAK